MEQDDKTTSGLAADSASTGNVHQLTHHNLPPMTEEDAVNDLVSKWHQGSGETPIHKYIGWTEDEYAHWVETCQLPSHNIERGNV